MRAGSSSGRRRRQKLCLGNITFGYDRQSLHAALEAGTTLIWRLRRDERGWRAFVSFSQRRAD